ncbi:MAG: Flp pilus assembly protein CpaB [Pseudomonadota bacterium]
MNGMRLAILGVALLTAAIAAFLAKGLVSTPPPVEAAPVEIVEAPTKDVLVLTRDVPIGEKLKSGDLSWTKWPEEAVAGFFITRDTDPDAKERLDTAVVRSTLYKGEPMIASKIIDPEERGFMAALLKPGMRAISVPISEETAAGGFILPNDKVDVIVTRRVESVSEGREGPTFRSDTVLSNVRILAIDQVFKEVDEKQVVVGRTATLELPPRHAEILAVAQAMGTINLSLRGWVGNEESYSDEPSIVVDISNGGGGNSSAVELTRYGQKKIVLPRATGPEGR